LTQVNSLLEDKYGLDVFVDWIEKPHLDRSKVTTETAIELRDVMDRSKSLVYVTSEKSKSSIWMPWELGYSDAKHGRVAVLPISSNSKYENQEFVGLYPYIDRAKDKDGNYSLWVNDSKDAAYYAKFKIWLKNGKLPMHPS